MRKTILITLLLIGSAALTIPANAQPPKFYSLLVGLQTLDAKEYNKLGVTYGDNATSGVAIDIDKMKKICQENGHQSTVLMNSHATRKKVLNAIDSIGKIIKPGDGFMFYFSGHGDQVKDTNGDERSGYDQTLVAYDKWIVDDDINTLLTTYFQKTLNIMIVDACHSSSSYKLSANFIDFPKTFRKVSAKENEMKIEQQQLSPDLCEVNNTAVIPEPYNLIYFGATMDSGLAAGNSDGGLMTYFLFKIYSDATHLGAWKRMTYPKFACEIAKKINNPFQKLQYHEVGMSVKDYVNSIPFKL